MNAYVTSLILGTLALAGIAVIGLASTASALVLPEVINPAPFRQTIQGTCNKPNPFPTGSGNTTCILVFVNVPLKRVLQIDNVNCFGGFGTAGMFMFPTQVDLARMMGFVPTQNGSALMQGPFYFKAGETPKLVTEASDQTGVAICSIFGTMWQTN